MLIHVKGKHVEVTDALSSYIEKKLQKLEKYFWALMRVMAKKGLMTKEEFLKELEE